MDEEVTDETIEQPFTFPQVKPLYSTHRRRDSKSSRRRLLRPLEFFALPEENPQEGDQSGSSQKTILEDHSHSCNSLSEELGSYHSSETAENIKKDKSFVGLTRSNGSDKFKLGTPFSSKRSESLVKRIPKNISTPECRKTEEKENPYFKDMKFLHCPLDQISNENNFKSCKKQDENVCGNASNNNKGERVFRNILNYDNDKFKKSFETEKLTKESNNGSNNGFCDAKGMFIKPVISSNHNGELHDSQRKSSKAPTQSVHVAGKNKDVRKEVDGEKPKETIAHNTRQSPGIDPTVLCINNVQYTVLGKLGQGGSSQVYQVLDKRTSSVVAVKCVNLADADDVTAKGYLKEIDMLSKLQSSNRVIKLIDHEYLKSQQILYVVMEKGDTDLSKLLKQFANTGEVSLPMIIYFWTEMLLAVQEIHNNGVVHADLKPANFLLVSGRLKLIDFGIASAMQNDATSVFKTSMHGTCNYMSPEAIRDPGCSSRTKVGYRSDVWSLGCILYNLLYKRTPFQHITNNFNKLLAISNPNHVIKFSPVKKCPPPLMEAVKCCLTYEYKKRPTVADLLAMDYIWPTNTS